MIASLLAYVQAGTHCGEYDCSHYLEVADVQRGVHYVSLGMNGILSVGMVEEGGKVTFREPRYD